MAQFRWDPDSYLALMRTEVPGYEQLQEAAVAASGASATRVLELGTGSGESTRRLLARHPGAFLVGIDASDPMLARARSVLPPGRVELHRRRLEDPLPEGQFDLAVSVLAVHHLAEPGKAALFRRVAARLLPGGRFVLADLVTPADPADVVTPIDGEYDTPSSVAEQLAWLGAAGMEAWLAWEQRDLAVMVGRMPVAEAARGRSARTAVG